MSRPFRFKQFIIVQENAAMKVGTDSVLLGSWAPSTNPKRILDIGTGTGILALMLAQRFSRAELIAVELDRDALADAEFNVAHSNWSKRISVLQGDFMDLSFSDHFDLILSNPPYFPADTFSPVAKRSLARNGKENIVFSWLSKASDLLSTDGSIAFILPVEQWEMIEASLSTLNLYLNSICFIKPKKEKAAHRVMVSLSFQKTTIEKTELVIENDSRHDYTKEYRDLTKDFYLDKI